MSEVRELSARLALVVMGVSGSGKTSVGEGIAARFGLTFVDGDCLHSAANVAKMHAGIALDNAIEHFRALQAGFAYSLPLDRIGLPSGAGSLDLSATYLHTFSHYTKTGEADKEQVLNAVATPKDSVVATSIGGPRPSIGCGR